MAEKDRQSRFSIRADSFRLWLAANWMHTNHIKPTSGDKVTSSRLLWCTQFYGYIRWAKNITVFYFLLLWAEKRLGQRGARGGINQAPLLCEKLGYGFYLQLFCEWNHTLHSLVNALQQPEVQVVTGLPWPAGVVNEHQPGEVCLPHLRECTWVQTHTS